MMPLRARHAGRTGSAGGAGLVQRRGRSRTGKTMPKFRVIERDLPGIYERMASSGRGIEKNGVAAHGLKIPVGDAYAELAFRQPRRIELAGLNDRPYPSLEWDREVCEAILALDPASNGELAFRAFEAEEAKTGLSLTDLAVGTRSAGTNFSDIVAQPRRVLTTPTWSAIVNHGRAYSPFTLSVERLVPWRTLTGRQHFYLDHENLTWTWASICPDYKPCPPATMMSELERSKAEAQGDAAQRALLRHLQNGASIDVFGDIGLARRPCRGAVPGVVETKMLAESGDWPENDRAEASTTTGCSSSGAGSLPGFPGTVFVYHATEREPSGYRFPPAQEEGRDEHSFTRAWLKPVPTSGHMPSSPTSSVLGRRLGSTGTRSCTSVASTSRATERGIAWTSEPDMSMIFHLDKCIGCHNCKRGLQEPVDRPQGCRALWRKQRRDPCPAWGIRPAGRIRTTTGADGSRAGWGSS